jgi:hypothetical protein
VFDFIDKQAKNIKKNIYNRVRHNFYILLYQIVILLFIYF